ncbi:hypothetical protein Enr13x_60730 [Stieleria neptunia]|uniref:Uncharacterized protein n=1 Tax=Stieleria neptunia TaxID=2527979 RepID=A0A518HZF6_9BACT|nr:hypothetical protein Enr13x_60730 [Stieleria neptunia]
MSRGNRSSLGTIGRERAQRTQKKKASAFIERLATTLPRVNSVLCSLSTFCVLCALSWLSQIPTHEPREPVLARNDWPRKSTENAKEEGQRVHRTSCHHSSARQFGPVLTLDLLRSLRSFVALSNPHARAEGTGPRSERLAAKEHRERKKEGPRVHGTSCHHCSARQFGPVLTRDLLRSLRSFVAPLNPHAQAGKASPQQERLVGRPQRPALVLRQNHAVDTLGVFLTPRLAHRLGAHLARDRFVLPANQVRR